MSTKIAESGAPQRAGAALVGTLQALPAGLVLAALVGATALAAGPFFGPDPEATFRRNGRPLPGTDPELLQPHWGDDKVVRVQRGRPPEADGYGRMTWGEWKRVTGRDRP
jgi:hypothetical protein